MRAGFVRAERAAILHGDYFTGKTHKIPQMSYLRYETPAIFRHLIGPPKQTTNTKNADESENRLKNIKNESNDTKTTVHSLFLGCVYTQKIYSIPRGAMLLLGSLRP